MCPSSVESLTIFRPDYPSTWTEMFSFLSACSPVFIVIWHVSLTRSLLLSVSLISILLLLVGWLVLDRSGSSQRSDTTEKCTHTGNTVMIWCDYIAVRYITVNYKRVRYIIVRYTTVRYKTVRYKINVVTKRYVTKWMLLQNGTWYKTVRYKMVRLQNVNHNKTERVTKQ